MGRAPHFYSIFCVENSGDAYSLYRKAFGAKKIREELDGTHITMDVFGVEIMLMPGDNPSGGCIHFETEADLLGAYEVLVREGTDCSLERDCDWASLAALVTDKYGVKWLFCI